MTLTYVLKHQDFLQHQLYAASKNKRIKKQRTRSWLLMTGCFLLIGVLMYDKGDKLVAYSLLAAGAITFLFYPLFQRYHYKKHYDRYIADAYKNKFGQTLHITFTDLTIESHDASGDGSLNLSALEQVSETAGYFYLKLKTGETLIIPKERVGDVALLRTVLKDICHRMKIEFVEDLNWKWR